VGVLQGIPQRRVGSDERQRSFAALVNRTDVRVACVEDIESRGSWMTDFPTVAAVLDGLLSRGALI
jgi:hypothetical protein